MEILVLETRNLSYGSSGVFLKKICEILKEYGVNVIHCIINDPEADSALLESFIGKKFDAVLDINSILPLAECDDGRYLDCIDAPFVNFIVDHPMHVHQYLNVRLKRYYVICIDRHHKEYIDKYYPHIKKTAAIPLAGIKSPVYKDSSYSGFKKRKYHIFFPGTYTPSWYYRQAMEEKNKNYLKQANEILHGIMDGDNTPIHDMYRNITSYKEERFAAGMYRARYIDRYIRDYIREKVVSAMLSEGFTVNVAGARWEMYSGKNKDRLILSGQCSYEMITGMAADSQAVLNVQPLFTEAPHDRIFNAAANGAAVITDTCSYLEENYSDCLLLYDKKRLYKSMEELKETLYDTETLYKMASGFCHVAEKETWEDRCKRILEFIS